MQINSTTKDKPVRQRLMSRLLGRPAAYAWTGILVIGFFILDLSLPLGVAAGVPYAVAVMASMRTARIRFIAVTTVVTASLTIFGLMMSPDGGEQWKVLANRTLAIFVILGAGSFAIYAISVRRRATRQAILFEQVRRRRVQDTNVQLMRSAEARSSFLGQISHELRTPLTSLTTFAHILDGKSETLSRERIQAHSEVIGRSARRLEVLINDLFDASGSETDSFKLNLTSVDIPQVVADTASDYAHHVRTLDQELVTDIDIPESSNYRAIADSVRIAQVVTNLLSNASKYSWPGSTLHAFCGLEGDKFIVKVTDHGAGISREDISKVFTPFFRVDSADVRAVPGAGLGLTIVKSIIELHDGQVYIESEKDSGTTVTFTIPAVIAS
jgi:signal transduction histidine kinase